MSRGGNLEAQGRSIRLGRSFSLRKGLFDKFGKKFNSCLWQYSSKTGTGEVELHREFQGIKRTWSAWIHSSVPCNFVIHVSCVCDHLLLVRCSVRLWGYPEVNGGGHGNDGLVYPLVLAPHPWLPAGHERGAANFQEVECVCMCVCTCVRDATCVKAF